MIRRSVLLGYKITSYEPDYITSLNTLPICNKNSLPLCEGRYWNGKANVK